jgi:hypothetical protein
VSKKEDLLHINRNTSISLSSSMAPHETKRKESILDISHRTETTSTSNDESVGSFDDDDIHTVKTTRREITIPSEFVCPITLAIMKYPMMSRIGHSFERQAILEWIANGNGCCPVTRTPLSYADIIPNRSLQAKIHAWNKMQLNHDDIDAEYCSLSMKHDSLLDFVGVLNFSTDQQTRIVQSGMAVTTSQLPQNDNDALLLQQSLSTKPTSASTASLLRRLLRLRS